MRMLTKNEIERLARRRNVKRIAVENFLATVHNNNSLSEALINLDRDARLYNWNRATVRAIIEGICLSAGARR